MYILTTSTPPFIIYDPQFINNVYIEQMILKW